MQPYAFVAALIIIHCYITVLCILAQACMRLHLVYVRPVHGCISSDVSHQTQHIIRGLRIAEVVVDYVMLVGVET